MELCFSCQKLLLTQSNILIDVSGDDGYWWVQPEGLHQASLQIFHLKSILESSRAVRVSEYLVQFLNNFVLDMLVNSHHGEEETASGGCGVVTLKKLNPFTIFSKVRGHCYLLLPHSRCFP